MNHSFWLMVKCMLNSSRHAIIIPAKTGDGIKVYCVQIKKLFK